MKKRDVNLDAEEWMALLRRAQAGEAGALEEFLVSCRPLVVVSCVALGRMFWKLDPDDIASVGWEVAWRTAGTFAFRGNYSAYFRKAHRLRVYDLLRVAMCEKRGTRMERHPLPREDGWSDALLGREMPPDWYAELGELIEAGGPPPRRRWRHPPGANAPCLRCGTTGGSASRGRPTRSYGLCGTCYRRSRVEAKQKEAVA